MRVFYRYRSAIASLFVATLLVGCATSIAPVERPGDGRWFDPDSLALASLLRDLADLQFKITSRTKDKLFRRRPFLQDPAIMTCVERPSSGSYPSGHATWGMAAALVLADMVPERRAALLARGTDYGEQR